MKIHEHIHWTIANRFVWTKPGNEDIPMGALLPVGWIEFCYGQ